MSLPIPNLSSSSQAGGGEITGSIFGGIHKGKNNDFPFAPPAAIASNPLKSSSSETVVLLGAMALAGFILLKK